MVEKKSALIIANSQYEDTVLRQLLAPAQDAEALAEVLRDPAIGGFDVHTLLNAPSYKVCETIEAFFDDRERDHLLLLYFSGHGVTDDDGMLYFATPNTQHKRLRSTALGAKWVNEIMIQCRSRRQVLLLDCCHSGAFARAKAGAAVSTGQQFEASIREEGRGRVVLTASDAMQYSFEGDQVEGQGVRSVFTQALVDGLRTGEADMDGDGQIKLDELYSYVHRRVRDKTPQQSPRRWDFDVEGEIVIAQNPRPIVAELPDDLQRAIASFVPEAREAAVQRLGLLLLGKHKGLALAARQALVFLKEDDSRRVSAAAEKCLGAYSEQTAEDKKGKPEKSIGEKDKQVVEQGAPQRPAEHEKPKAPPKQPADTAKPEDQGQPQKKAAPVWLRPPPKRAPAPPAAIQEGKKEKLVLQLNPPSLQPSGTTGPGPVLRLSTPTQGLMSRLSEYLEDHYGISREKQFTIVVLVIILVVLLVFIYTAYIASDSGSSQGSLTVGPNRIAAACLPEPSVIFLFVLRNADVLQKDTVPPAALPAASHLRKLASSL